MEMRGACVLVTGGAGFIGSHLAERLLAAGAVVRVLDNFSAGSEDNIRAFRSHVEVFEGSVLDQDLMRKACTQVEAIFHLAAVTGLEAFVTDPESAHEVNTLGILRVLEAARRHDAKLIYSSSSSVYGTHKQLPIREASNTAPVTPYAVQKVFGEQYLRCYHHLHGVLGRPLRYFNVFGPRQNPASSYSGVVALFMRRALAHRPIEIFGDGSTTRDLIYVTDVAEANICAYLSDAHDVDAVNIGTGQSTSILRLAEEIVQRTGSRSTIIHRAVRSGDMRHSLADCTLAIERLGFLSKTTVEDGLDKTIAYYRDEALALAPPAAGSKK